MAQYYVASKKDLHSGWMDGCIVWWRADGHGYTYDLNDAGIYTDDDKAKGYPSTADCVYVPKEIAEACSRSPKLAWWSDGWKNPVCKAMEFAEALGAAKEAK